MLPCAPRRTRLPPAGRPFRPGAADRAPGSVTTCAAGMTGPHLATRAGAAISRRRTGPSGKTGPSGEPGAAPGAGQPWGTRAARLLGRHWLLVVLLAAGLALRIAAQIAYQPALIYVDTLKYLYGASPGADPLGYTLVLRSILVLRGPQPGRAGPAPAGPGHGRGPVRRAAAPGNQPVAGRRGGGAGAAGRLPGADRADDHAGRLVRGDDRGRPGRAPLAAGGHRPAGRAGGGDPRPVGHACTRSARC